MTTSVSSIKNSFNFKIVFHMELLSTRSEDDLELQARHSWYLSICCYGLLAATGLLDALRWLKHDKMSCRVKTYQAIQCVNVPPQTAGDLCNVLPLSLKHPESAPVNFNANKFPLFQQIVMIIQ